MSRILLTGLVLASTLVPSRVVADDAPEKRSEGRYFVEAAEVMLRANDFDAVMATADADGPGPGGAVTDVAELSGWNIQQPKITIGLNRPGKTSLSFTFHDFELSSHREPPTFEDAGDQIVTTPLLPPGIEFQRQRPGGGSAPNWGEEYGYIRRMDYKSLDFSVQRTTYENEHFRLRWIAGLRYAQLLQKTSARFAYAEEGSTYGTHFRDIFSISAQAETHGLGPHFGLNGRYLVGKDKKWVFQAQADAAMLPESTSCKYLISLVDIGLADSGFPGIYVPSAQSPVMPGVPRTATAGDTFNSVVNQTDFTELTWLFEATASVRYQITRGISIGVEGWHMRWLNLLSDAGVLDTVNRDATYEMLVGDPDNPDPALRDTESVIHVPRFSHRDTATFDGISLNLRFEF